MRIRSRSDSRNPEKGVSFLVEYLILSIILMIFFSFIALQFNDLLGKAPISTAMDNQFQDVGNQIAVKLTDISLIAPENGYIKAKVFMPYTVGDYDFKAEFTQVGGEYVLKISSERAGKTQYVPINNLALKVIPVGSTFSITPVHEIEYSKYTHLMPTAVALAYPTTVEVGSNVTFDMTLSTGEGDLWFRWDFGDGSSYEAKYDPNNPSQSLVEYSYSAGGTYTATLTVWDSYGYSDTSNITIKVLNQTPNPFLFATKYIIPEITEPGNPVQIVIYLRGGGIIEQARNVSVMHVIDVSGSMDPDYFPYWNRYIGYTPYISMNGNVSPSKWEGSVYVDSSFDRLEIHAHSNSEDVDLWVKSPDGDFARAQYISSYVEKYKVNNPVEGNWTISVVADYPKDSDTVTVEVWKRSRGSWYLIASYNFVLAANPKTFSINVPDEVDDLKIKVTPINGSKELHTWIREPDGSLVGPYWSSYDEYYEDSSAQPGQYTIYVVADFPYGSQDFQIDSYIAKIDAVKIAAKTFNGLIKSSDQVGVAYFNTTSAYSPYYPKGEVIQSLTNDTYAANSSIDSLRAYGGTPMALGIKAAREELVANTTPGNIPVMIILSDGNPTITSDGVASETLAIQEALNEAEITKQTLVSNESILIYTIGFGSDANATLLQQIATSPDYYFFAATSEELENIYEQIAKELKEKAATNITITDVLTSNVTLSQPPPGANISTWGNQTVIQWNLTSIRINETWTASFEVVPAKEGLIKTNVFGLSNVTYLPWPFTGMNTTTIKLPAPDLNVTRISPEKVVLK
ncbi:PKD domain-containing protein [Geoglobus acetivorans]|uniref:VWA domain-containing protein n=1 Tax=Geoglobus acetivorans TaxID=565033 RepID=A0ABZ3H4J5_GEOAI|nr:VWA domain-containing protein [Geoglobus acetivorans]